MNKEQVISKWQEALGNVEPDIFPYGSCQYKSIHQAYLAAKEVGPHHFLVLYPKEDLGLVYNKKGREDRIVHEILIDYLLTKLEDSYIAELCHAGLYHRISCIARGQCSVFDIPEHGWYCQDSDDVKDLDMAIRKVKTIDDALEMQAEAAWDLWSAILGIPEVPEEGPIGDQDARGITMAILEWLIGREIDFKEWST